MEAMSGVLSSMYRAASAGNERKASSFGVRVAQVLLAVFSISRPVVPNAGDAVPALLLEGGCFELS